jgi:Rrf2 family transcriptional regulator, iron-sulfur cluster assembly transcription factor
MISKTALSVVKALAYLAEQPEGTRVGAAAIAEKTGAGQNYLGKILQSLTREGLVESQKGLWGGFKLARDPHTITLYDVVEPIDQVSRWEGCFMGGNSCGSESPCAVHHRWGAVRDAYQAFLKETTIADLATKKVSLQLPEKS